MFNIASSRGEKNTKQRQQSQELGVQGNKIFHNSTQERSFNEEKEMREV